MEPSKRARSLEGGIGAALDTLRQGRMSAVELVEACLAGIEQREGLNAVTEVRPEALGEAERATGPLAGIPVVVKDCFVDGDRPPSMGSRAPARWLRGTAAVLERLRAAGAVVVAYSNLHEWMVGISSQVGAYGPVVNPIAPELIAGGSSGGSAAALAAGLVPAALGSDAGGSIRIPAACCGVVGLKPSWGLLPTEGFVDHGSAIDHVGPMACSVGDTRTLLEVLSGRRYDLPDPADLHVGVAADRFFDDALPEVAAVALEAVEMLRPHVASVRGVAIAGAAEAGTAVGALLLRDVHAMLSADRDDWREVLQAETARAVALGEGIDVVAAAHAEQIRRRVRAGWAEAFGQVDVVVTPTLPGRIAPVSERSVDLASGPAAREVAYVAWNAPMNLAGVPCLSLPSGHLADGQDVSVSFTAAAGEDAVVLSLGSLLEELLAGRES